MKNKTLYIYIVVFIALVGAVLYYYKNSHSSDELSLKIEDDYQSTFDYLEANGCDYSMSNNAYTVCAENALKKIQAEKKEYYDRFQETMKSMDKNALGLDENKNREFQDWYKNSDDYSHSRCLATVYYTGAGSAYEQNISICKIFETQRDIQLLDELYEKKEYFRG